MIISKMKKKDENGKASPLFILKYTIGLWSIHETTFMVNMAVIIKVLTIHES